MKTSFMIILIITIPSLLLFKNVYSLTAKTSHSENSNGQNLFKLVVFSFDGFRHDYVNPQRTPNFYAIANAGVQGEMLSTFITKTYPNHQSIATGLYEPYHGVINNKFYDPIIKSYFDVNNASSLWWDQNNISVPIYIANQYYESNRYSISIQWPGSNSGYTDGKNLDRRIHVHYLQDYNPSIDWYKRIDLLIKWLQHPEKPANFAFVYYSEPDTHAHEYGPFSDEVYEQVRNLDDVVGYFRKQLVMKGLAHRTNVIYLSDHGMAEIRSERSLYLDKCDQDFPGLQYIMIGSSPVFSIQPISAPYKSLKKNQSLAESVREALNLCAEKRFKNKFKVYLQEEIPDSYHYKNNNRILPILVCAEEGYDINYNDTGWQPKGHHIWGNHGYNASLPSMRPLFLAQGPRFKRAYRHPVPFENIDLYPLMLNLLDIPQEQFPSNGTFERVHQMLSNQLYLSDEDILQPKDTTISKNALWIRLFIYLIAGFLVILIAGACFVFVVGLNKKTFTSLLTTTDSKFAAYLQRIWNNRRHDGPSYHMFANERPVAHLDSSSSYEDDDENELYHRQDRIRMPKPPFSSNQLTDIDWDILGTGLDIDLASQLNDSNRMIKSNRDYLPKQDSDDDESDEKLKPENISQTEKNESILLLIDENNEDTDNDNEKVKAKINIKEYEDFLYNNQDDEDNRQDKHQEHKDPNKLINI